MHAIPASHRWARRLALFVSGTLTLMIAAWVLSDPRANLATDWTSFDNAGGRLRDGTTIYRPWDAETETLPYLYPPFVLWLAWPLGYLGFYASWLWSAALTGIALVGGMALLVRSFPELPELRRRENTTAMIVALSSGTVIGAALIGQYSGIYVLVFGVALWLWVHDRRFAAGVALAILVMKPNLAIAVPVVLVWSRSWRSLAGFATGTVGLVALSLPFGLQAWPAFVDNVGDMAQRQANGQLVDAKMVTIIGGFQALTGVDQDSFLAVGVWLITTAVLGVATLALWRPRVLAASPHRAFAGLAIFIIVANPRMYFYDATLLVFAVACLWLFAVHERGALERATGRLAAALWILSWGTAFASLNAFVGPLAGALLLVVARDSLGSASPAAADDVLQASVGDRGNARAVDSPTISDAA